MTKDEALKAARNGAIAACISGVLTVAIILFAMMSDAEGQLANYNNPLNLIDAAIIFVCAFGLLKKSRTAAVVLFIYFLVAKLVTLLDTGHVSGLGMALVFLYYYGKAIQGTFVYHKLAREADPEYKAITKKGVIFLGTGVITVGVLLCLAFFSTVGVMPSTRVQAGSELSDADISLLRDEGVLDDEEQVEFFYSQGVTSVLSSGNVLTQSHVILYFTEESGDLSVYMLAIDEVTAVDLEEKGSPIKDSVYIVRTSDPDRWIKLFLSTEQKGDEKFVAALRKRIG